MNVLMLTDPDRDYAADYLAHGFVAAGHRLIDWPRKASLHCGENYEPLFDCDLNLPEHYVLDDQVLQMLAARQFDLIVVPTLRPGVRAPLMLWQRLGLLERNRDIVVACDGEDHCVNTEPAFAQLLGFHPAAYFKRELPPGETWGIPLPFGYPAERVVKTRARSVTDVVYSAYVWEWCGSDSLRYRLRERLMAEPITNRVSMKICPSPRMSVRQNHEMNQSARIAISPSGRGYHTNRHLEIVADGCCPVIESPWMQWPGAFVDGVECRYFRNEMECVDIVRELLANPEQVHAMAQVAQAALLARHTTRHRAETVMGAVH